MDVQLHRKQRLRELIEHNCGNVIAVFAERIERNDSYVSRMLYPPEKAGAKPIADKMMRVIEAAFGLSRAWLDLPLGAELPNPESPTAISRHKALWQEDKKLAQHKVNEARKPLNEQPANEQQTALEEASSLLIKMSPEGRKNSIAYLRFMLTQHPGITPSSGGERDSIPHQKAA